MNILLVTSFPPMNCGIAKYAEQQQAALRGEGHRVDVLSPPDGGGDFHENLLGGISPIKLLKYVWAYDEIFIHFTPYFFYDPARRLSRIVTSLALLMLMLVAGRRITLLPHETSFQIGQTNRGPLRHRIDRWYWQLARRVIFHSVLERDAFANFYRLAHDRKEFEIWPHEKYFVRRFSMERSEARQSLGLEPGQTLLLCIGFIQPHKGFDQAIEALARVKAPQLRLKIVGSVRLFWDQAHAYAQRLHDLADRDPRCEVLEGYLSDDLFDTWIVAADYVVVPYREIWSSSIVARAKLYGRTIVAARAGGLAEQVVAGSHLFSTPEELEGIFSQIATQSTPENPEES